MKRAVLRAAAVASLLCAGMTAAGPDGPGRAAEGVAAPQRTPLDDTLDRAARYVVRYETEGSAVVAEERYTQELKPGCGRARAGGAVGDARPGGDGRFWDAVSRPSTRKGVPGPTRRELLSDVLMVQLPDRSWAGFRDVAVVDGHPVRDRSERLQDLFLRSPATLGKIQQESARYNIGPIQPQFNLPTFALAYLHPDVRGHFVFSKAGEETLDGVRAVVVAFTEATRPTIVRDTSGRDVPSTGHFWIDPLSGEVWRSRLVAGGAGTPVLVETTVSYSRHPEWKLLLPARMDEVREEPGRPDAPCLVGEAEYSRFRRFEVKVEEKIKRPGPAPTGSP